MKTLSIATVLFFGICAVCPTSAKTVVHFPSSSDDVLEKGESFLLVFDRAVVDAAQVGKPADGKLNKFTSADGQPLPVTGQWQSPNMLKCTPTEEIPFRAAYEWKPEGNALYADGTPIPAEPIKLEGRQHWTFRVYSMNRSWIGSDVPAWDSFMVVIDDVVPEPGNTPNVAPAPKYNPDGYQSWDEALSKSIGIATYTYQKGQKQPGANLPVNWEPATLEILKKSANWQMRNMAGKWLQKGYSEKVTLPGVYIVSPREFLPYGVYFELVNVNASFLYMRSATKHEQTQTMYLGRVNQFKVSGSYCDVEDSGKRTFSISLSQPVYIADWNQFLAKHLSIKSFRKGDKDSFDANTGQYTITLTANEDEETPAQKVYLAPDKKAIAQLEQVRPNWYKRIPLEMTGDEAVFRLHWKLNNLLAVDGQTLEEETSQDVEPVRPNLSTLYLDAGNNGVLYAGGRKLKAEVESMKDLQVRGYRIRDEFTCRTYDAYRKIYQEDTDTGLPSTATDKAKRHLLQSELLVADQTGNLTVDVKGKTEAAINLDELFGGKKLTPGMYFIEVEAHASEAAEKALRMFNDYRGDTPSYVTQSLVQVTDLGLLHKKSPDTMFIYAYSLATGKSVPNAQVCLMDKYGAELTSVTAPAGTVIIPTKGLKAEPAFIRISAGADSYLSPVSDYCGDVDLERFRGVKTLPYAWESLNLSPTTTPETKVFMFSDRNLYRPGETMHLKGIVRNLLNNKLELAPVDTLTLTVCKRGRDLMTKQVDVTPDGTFTLDYEFPEEEPGYYNVKAVLTMVGDPATEEDIDNHDFKAYWREDVLKSNREFTHGVSVMEFKRNEFEVTPTLQPLKIGDLTVSGDVTAINFTGTPVSNAGVNWTLSSYTTNFYPKNYSAYRFGDHREQDCGYWETYYGYDYGEYFSSDWQHEKAKLDKDGKGRVEFTMKKADFPQVREILLRADVTNGNEQTISASREAVWYPAEFFVGVKNISSIYRQGTPLDLRLIALSNDGKPFDGYGVGVDVKVTRTAFRPVRYESESNTTVRNDKQTETILEQKVTICPEDSVNKVTGGKQVTIPTPKDGIYIVTLSGKDMAGREFRTAVKYWVYGSDTSPWEYHDGLKVDIIPDKQLYKPGDTARLLVQTPIEGEVIVTVERENVLRTYTRTLTLNNPVIEIPLEDADTPNVYASVFLVKGAELSERKTLNPQLKLGYAVLNVTPDKHRLNIKVDAPTVAVRPGDPCVVEGVVKDSAGTPVRNAEVCLFAEDEGTLQVIGFKTPDPMPYFYSKRPLAVNTCTTLEQFLEEDWKQRSTDNKGTFIGGGGDMELTPDNPRSDFNPCAVWLASLKTDENGRFKAEYVNPDTLTRYRVMAVALAGKDAFGRGESAYVVNKPIMLEAAPPFTGTVGDSLNIPVTVSQTENRAGQWIVTMKSANGVATAPQATQTLTLNGNQPKTLTFNVKFNTPGEAKLVWSICPADANGAPLTNAEAARLKDSVEHSFMVVPPFPELREIRNFTLTANQPMDLSTQIKESFAPGTPVAVTLGTSPFLFAAGNIDYLLQYPYGCLEQLSSTSLPWIYEPMLSRYLPGFKAKTPQERARVLNRAINKIFKNQLAIGGLSYWQNSETVSEYCSYAALVLTLAKEQGIEVPETELNHLYAYLEKSLNDAPTKDLLSAWALARAGRLNASLANRLLDKVSELEDKDHLYLALALAESAKAEHKTKAMELLAKDMKVRDAYKDMLTVLAMLKLAPEDPQVAELARTVVVERLLRSGEGYGFYSTWGSGWDVLLMGEYLKTLKDARQTATVSVDNNGNITEKTCSKEQPTHLNGAIGQKTVLTVKGEGTVYGTLNVKGRATNQKDDAAVNKGFAVLRLYEKLDADGKWTPSNEFRVGDLVRITLHVDKGPNPLKYVVMEDYLPSAFEALNPELVSQLPALPKGANDDNGYFYWNSWVSNREFLKDRVRFFADSWVRDRFTARYMARVTKSGAVAAPAAKAEMMYQPATYGWSIPQTFKVAPK